MKKLGDSGDGPTAEEKRNPKAFLNKSRMKAKLQRARSADKEQKRMHGMVAASSTLAPVKSHASSSTVSIQAFAEKRMHKQFQTCCDLRLCKSLCIRLGMQRQVRSMTVHFNLLMWGKGEHA